MRLHKHNQHQHNCTAAGSLVNESSTVWNTELLLYRQRLLLRFELDSQGLGRHRRPCH